MKIQPGTQVISPNGNPGTIVGNMTADGSIVAVKLDNGRQIGCLADKLQCANHDDEYGCCDTCGRWASSV